ncbi:MAG TPA: hypothetical protein VHZ51_02260 [Ktedonobacteraceae bacterium]|nr:hypothetical protein [Ktedonobacteraceae bacterium]
MFIPDTSSFRCVLCAQPTRQRCAYCEQPICSRCQIKHKGKAYCSMRHRDLDGGIGRVLKHFEPKFRQGMRF